jgi:glycosyltransferase involved in cell wall biosynthesis
MAPKISVVLPVFNGASGLSRTMESILAQTEGDFELIVVDDGSTDGTSAMLAEYASRDSRLRVLTQPNAGLTRALIKGCEAARAPIIARQDCGDVSHPERLKLVTPLLESKDCAVACCEVAYVGPNGEMLYTTNNGAKNLREGLLRAGTAEITSLPAGAAAIMRTDAYREAGGYRPQFYFAQDLDLWIRMAARGAIAIHPTVLYEARVDVGSISRAHRDEQIACTSLAIAVRDARNDRERNAALEEVARIRPSRSGRHRSIDASALYFVANCLRKRNDPRWRAYVKRAIRRDLLHLRSWLLLLRGTLS